jgi:DNA-binding response OmpR family regulator
VKILLVDDEVEFVSTLAERLKLRGIAADWVSGPAEAFIKVWKECYDLAVLDVKMPRIDGIALKRKLQKRCPDMKFIFLTGHGSRESYQAGSAEAGSDYYLMKPVRLEELMAKISEIEKQYHTGGTHE